MRSLSVRIHQPLPPAEAGFGGRGRLVLTPDPAVVANAVEMGEEEQIVDLAGPRLVPSGVVRHLDVADARQVLLYGRGELTFHALRVVDVVLNEGVVGTDVVEDRECLAGPADEE